MIKKYTYNSNLYNHKISHSSENAYTFDICNTIFTSKHYFIQRWKVGCGFYGRQGGESLHNAINKSQRYDIIKCAVDQLCYTMN